MQYCDNQILLAKLASGCLPKENEGKDEFDILLEDKTLDTYTETPTYYISTGRCEQATFTKTEFLDSIEKQKIKTKK